MGNKDKNERGGNEVMIKQKIARQELKDKEELHGYRSSFEDDRSVSVVCHETYYEFTFVKNGGSAVITTQVTVSRDAGDELAVLIRRLNGSMDEIKKWEAELQRELAKRNEGLLKWLLGESGEFPARKQGEGQFWWRSELRKRMERLFSQEQVEKAK